MHNESVKENLSQNKNNIKSKENFKNSKNN